MWALHCLRWSFGKGGKQKMWDETRGCRKGGVWTLKKRNIAGECGWREWMSLIQRCKSGLFSQERPQEAFKGLKEAVQRLNRCLKKHQKKQNTILFFPSTNIIHISRPVLSPCLTRLTVLEKAHAPLAKVSRECGRAGGLLFFLHSNASDSHVTYASRC